MVEQLATECTDGHCSLLQKSATARNAGAAFERGSFAVAVSLEVTNRSWTLVVELGQIGELQMPFEIDQ